VKKPPEAPKLLRRRNISCGMCRNKVPFAYKPPKTKAAWLCESCMATLVYVVCATAELMEADTKKKVKNK
jgi:hypothetical protein